MTNEQIHRRTTAIPVLLLCGLTLFTGCRQQTPAPAPPLKVAQQIVNARQSRDLATITQHVTTEDREALADMLLAIDEFDVQAIRLRTAVARHIGGGISRGCDLTSLTAELALFSQQVELLDETVDGDKATVAYALAGRLPTKRAAFVLEANHWRYDPGDFKAATFGPAFRELADGLAKVAEAVEAEKFAADEIRKNPQPLYEELRRRLEPGLKLMPKPAEMKTEGLGTRD